MNLERERLIDEFKELSYAFYADFIVVLTSFLLRDSVRFILSADYIFILRLLTQKCHFLPSITLKFSSTFKFNNL